MKYVALIISAFFVAWSATAQKPFTEGTITYKVKLLSPDQREISGMYTFTLKGAQIKKELKLNNGYQDIVLINNGSNTVYSLQNLNGKKYAIELSMADMQKRQEKYAGYVIQNEENNRKNIAGYAVYKGNVNYKDGSVCEVYYTKDWFPAAAMTFERFPNAKFFPMYFTYTDENNVKMQFEAEKISSSPVENAVFRIPGDYKMISNTEYKQMSK